jgi:5-formyltetrahydrofolate cyclo-ligase
MDKQEFRKRCLARLKSSPTYAKYAKDKKISQKIETIIKKEKPKSILFYLPISMEVNLNGLLRKYKKRLKIFVPFIEEESFKMVEYRLPLERNSFGIFEPKAHHLAQKYVDLIIVPVIGIDRNMQRVGFGKGMYDRFFAKLHKKPVVIFVQREMCKTPHKVCDNYDIQCHYYVTSKEIIKN